MLLVLHLVLVWDNAINLNFSLPYYFASFLLIYWFGTTLLKRRIDSYLLPKVERFELGTGRGIFRGP